MRSGYSILLGEYIDANSLEHRDCEPFQIVCPSCHEPLFKVERSISSVHYLSHYKQSDSYDAECERRVSSKSNSEIHSHNTVSRNQRLQYFLAIFKKALKRDPFFNYSKGIEHSHKQINYSKAFCFLRKGHYDTAARKGGLGEPTEFKEFAEFYIKESGQFDGFPITGFSISTQIRIASDLMKLLTTPQGEPNYNALFNHSAIYLLQRCRTPSTDEGAEGIQVSQNIAYFLSTLIQSGKRQGMQVIGEMLHTPIAPPFVMRTSSYFLKVASEIAHEMIGTLIRLPYFSLLKEMKK